MQSIFLHSAEWFHYYLIRLSLSFAFFSWPVMYCLSSLLCHPFHLPLPICTVFLYSSLLLLIHCVVLMCVCVCVCVCHSAKILLTCGSACLSYGDCSFILALAAHGVYVSAKGILPGIDGDPPWSWILWHWKQLRAYFHLAYVWI